jgi:hypothetical protein
VSLPQPAAAAVATRVSRGETGVRLNGMGRTVARSVWTVLVGLPVVVFVAALPAEVAQLRLAAAQVQEPLRHLPSANGGALLRLVLSPQVYPAALVSLEVILLAAFALAAVVIFVRESDDRMAIFVSVTLVNYAAMSLPALDTLATAHPQWQFPVRLVQGIGLECELLLFYLSPDGRFVPAWTRLLAVVWTIWRVVTLFLPAFHVTFVSMRNGMRGPGPVTALAFVLFAGWIGTGLYAQVYRYRFVSSPVQRQQTKWVVVGVVVGLAGYVAFVLPRIALRFVANAGPVSLAYTLMSAPLYLACLLAIPVCITFSILRYHLWNVDVVINRALVYGALTGTLLVTYVASVMMLQFVFRAVTQQDSSVAIVASTLTIVALSRPLRDHIQRTIDRRFYRRRYNAGRTLAAFGEVLAHEVDLGQLSEQLVAVVERTMEPAHVSLWLRTPSRDAPAHEP